jgi:dTDP-4-amino-4,6-dideoxygalactose transaminase
MDVICAFAKANGLKVVEDCAQSHGAKLAGKMTGTFGDAGCFSFYPTKNFPCFNPTL